MTKGMMIVNGVADDGGSRWDGDQSELVGAIIAVAQRRGLSKRRLWRNSRPVSAKPGKGSDLDRFVPVLHAGRFAVAVAAEARMRCGGMLAPTVFLKRSMPLFSLAGAFRVRRLW